MAVHSAASSVRPASRKSHIFLTGRPGVGKTTAIRRVIELVQAEQKTSLDGCVGGGEAVDGFYTEERREVGRGGSKRVGFDVVTLSGERQSLADAMPDTPDPTKRRPRFVVGRYGVNLDKFERAVLPILRKYVGRQCQDQVLIVDEVGKMEAFSNDFLEHVKQLLDSDSSRNVHVIGTIPSPGGRYPPALRAVLRLIETNSSCAVLEVTQANRQGVPATVIDMLRSSG